MTDSASAITNGTNGYVAIRRRSLGSAAWDPGSAAFALIGLSGVARTISLEKAVEKVQEEAVGVAEDSIGKALTGASNAGSPGNRSAPCNSTFAVLGLGDHHSIRGPA